MEITYKLNIIQKAFYWLLYTVCIAFATTVLTFFYMPAKVTFYSLSDAGSGTQGIRIQKHIDWAPDDYIILDRSVSYEQAVELIKELNKTIK